MREKEKMLQGLLYDANYDSELVDERIRCKCLCAKYNALPPDKTGDRKELLRQIFEKTGENFLIEPNFGVITVIISKSAKTSIRTIIV